MTTHTAYISIIVILTVIIVALLIWIRDLNDRIKKSSQVVQRLRLQERTQLSQLENKNDQNLNKEEQLFVNLCKYMDVEHPFTNADLKVEDLAKAMNTNRTYLGNSIRTYANGLTIQNFITRYRLRYAESLLRTNHEMGINEICELAGFSSRSTFNRQFYNFFGYTPSECREMSLRQRAGEQPTSLENTLEK